MHLFQTSLSSDPATSEPLDPSTFSFQTGTQLARAPRPELQLLLLLPLQATASLTGWVLRALASAYSSLAEFSHHFGMTHVNFPSSARRFNMSPGSPVSAAWEFPLKCLKPNEHPYPLKTAFSFQLLHAWSFLDLGTRPFLTLIFLSLSVAFLMCPTWPSLISLD